WRRHRRSDGEPGVVLEDLVPFEALRELQVDLAREQAVDVSIDASAENEITDAERSQEPASLFGLTREDRGDRRFQVSGAAARAAGRVGQHGFTGGAGEIDAERARRPRDPQDAEVAEPSRLGGEKRRDELSRTTEAVEVAPGEEPDPGDRSDERVKSERPEGKMECAEGTSLKRRHESLRRKAGEDRH